jgi:uncharacterized protein YdeI (YjbR/CyaY-like superfamily)
MLHIGRSTPIHIVLPRGLTHLETARTIIGACALLRFSSAPQAAPMPRKPRSAASKASRTASPAVIPSPSPSPSPNDGLLFPDQTAFIAWLEGNHVTATAGTWLRLSKKSNADPATQTLTYDQAVDASLFFGWIDGQRKSCPGEGDEPSTHFAQRFTPRRGASIWSKRNVDKINTFLAQKPCPIRPAGLAQIEAAKADGRWERAYSGPKDIVVPADLEEALKAKGGVALATFEGLNRTKRYPILHRIETARGPAARKRKIAQIVDLLAEGKSL